MKFKAMFFATLISISSLFIMPASVEAKTPRVPWNGKVVEVVSNLPASWDVKDAVEDIDWYTASDMRLVGKCSGKNQCVLISTGSVPGLPIGWSTSCRPAIDQCQITIDLKKAAHRKGINAATRRWLIRHELGHYRMLSDRKACDSTMNPYVRCHGHVPPNTFSASERAVLRRW